MWGYGIVRCGYLHDDCLFFAGVDRNMPYITNVLDVDGKYKAVPAARNRCCVGGIGQRDHRFTREEGNPPAISKRVSVRSWYGPRAG